jgi:hypothetical protein
MKRALAIALVFAFGAVTQAAARSLQKESEKPFLHYPRTFTKDDVTIPECTPLKAEVDWKDELAFKDPNRVWETVSVTKNEWNDAHGIESFAECLASVPRYKGRYTSEQAQLVEKGAIIAGMPLEFALMILGPAAPGGGLGSVLDPVTGQARRLHAMTWVRVPSKVQGAQTFFTVLGFLGAGVAGMSSNFNTSIRALQVTAVASVGQALTWEATLSKAQVVIVEATDDLRIERVMAY